MATKQARIRIPDTLTPAQANVILSSRGRKYVAMCRRTPEAKALLEIDEELREAIDAW